MSNSMNVREQERSATKRWERRAELLLRTHVFQAFQPATGASPGRIPTPRICNTSRLKMNTYDSHTCATANSSATDGVSPWTKVTEPRPGN